MQKKRDHLKNFDVYQDDQGNSDEYSVGGCSIDLLDLAYQKAIRWISVRYSHCMMKVQVNQMYEVAR